MTGLDKIIKVIEEDAAAAAEAVIAEAKKEAEGIISEAKKEGDLRKAEIVKDSEEKIKVLNSRSESAAILQKKKIILESKLNIIDEIIEEAKNSLIDLPVKDYFEHIIKIIKKRAHNNQGIIAFSQKDLERIPDDFEDKLNQELHTFENSNLENASLEVSKSSVNINGGCILIYGDIEENCSFDALFNTSKEQLQDKVAALLFE